MIFPDEIIQQEWKINYLPPTGGRFNGKLTITDKRFLMDASFDQPFEVLFENSVLFFNGKTILSINKSDISSLRVVDGLIVKELTISVHGKIHRFQKKLFSLKPILNTIK